MNGLGKPQSFSRRIGQTYGRGRPFPMQSLQPLKSKQSGFLLWPHFEPNIATNINGRRNDPKT